MQFPTVIWNGENVAEIECMLAGHLARADKHGDKLHLIGIGLNVELGLGDSVLLDGDRLGIVRVGDPMPPDVITWDGTNVPAINEFLAPYHVWLAVQGEMLCVYGGSELIAAMNRGDRIEKIGSQIHISRAGKDHRN
jgi:hypothetical protein